METKVLGKVIHGALHVLGAAVATFLLGWLLVVVAQRSEEHALIDGVNTLAAVDARIVGDGTARYEEYHKDGNIGYWDQKSQSLTWTIVRDESARYRVSIDYSLPEGRSTQFKLVAEGEELKGEVAGRGDWATWQTQALGEMALPGGSYLLKLIPTEISEGKGVMNFVRLKLEPVSE
ncbi:hypothetical protein [Rubritalea tangerina]|uniref:CBM6 domain-containing protein n=1 Tax=Rubritalea tangerina TaxID=430798 RepID=A0ABW4ZE24_9BACT